MIQLERKLYHTADLGLVWGIKNKNTLHTTIKRYVKKGILVTVFKGLYAIVPLDQVDPVELGVAVAHRFAYLSCESVLERGGVIAQKIIPYTFVSDFSRHIAVAGHEYLFRKMRDDRLYNPEGVEIINGQMIATPERAGADMKYFAPKYYFDSK